MVDTPENVTQFDSPPNRESHTPRSAANFSLANHSPDEPVTGVRPRNKQVPEETVSSPAHQTWLTERLSQSPCDPQPISEARPAANLSLANHSPEPWALFSGQTPGILYEIRARQPNPDFDEIVALIPCETDDPVTSRIRANALLIEDVPRLLRVFRQLFATFLVPMEFRDTPEQIEAVKAASELLHDLQRAGVF